MENRHPERSARSAAEGAQFSNAAGHKIGVRDWTQAALRAREMGLIW